MATKLRSIFRMSGVKAAAFLLAVFLLSAVISYGLLFLSDDPPDPEVLMYSGYMESPRFARELVYPALERLQNPGAAEDFHYLMITEDGPVSSVRPATEESFRRFGTGHIAYLDGRWIRPADEMVLSRIQAGFPAEVREVHLAFPEDALVRGETRWQQDRQYLIPRVAGLAAGLVLSLILIVYLTAVTGRRPGDDRLHPGKTDRIWTEFLVLGLLTVLPVWLVLMARLFFPSMAGMIRLGGAMVLSVTAITLCGFIWLALVRKLKAGTFLSHSLLGTLVRSVTRFFRSLFDGSAFSGFPLTRSLFYRQTLFIVLSLVLVLFFLLTLAVATPLFFLPILLEVLLVYAYISGNRKTYQEIQQGMNESLEEKLRAERLKVDLITNVSHDLKTPLTSLISYVDLLSRQEELGEESREYVRILADKSERLQKIISDLFDLARGTSGNLPVNLEKLDLGRLLRQTLGDMEDRIRASGLTIKTRLPEEPHLILSDGSRLYRVFQNLLDNALTYSQPGTRIFLELARSGETVCARIINTAGYEMDFTADEVLRRFSRGDASQGAGGTGLGLSIAESFTRASGGTLQVFIDGDQFRVELRFPAAGSSTCLPEERTESGTE